MYFPDLYIQQVQIPVQNLQNKKGESVLELLLPERKDMTINHRERFVIGEKDCPIGAGTYTVDFPNKRGVIHVTDAEGNFKYRIDGYYRDGHSDSLYEYTPLPAKMELAKGDVFYIINCNATLDRVSE